MRIFNTSRKNTLGWPYWLAQRLGKFSKLKQARVSNLLFIFGGSDMAELNELLNTVVGWVWGLPLVFLLVGTGLLATVVFKGIQIRGFWHAIEVILGRFDDKGDPGEISHFQALCTALSATVGLGNIAGVAVAIHLGGPGALFWMVVTGFLGMALKYSEVTLAMMHRQVGPDGRVHGGAMYYIEKGLGPKFRPLAIFFAVACMMASFGAANMFQANQVAAIFYGQFQIPHLLSGVMLAVLTGLVIIGGIQRIGKVASLLVPFMGGVYVVGALAVIFLNITMVPELLYTVVVDAFSGTAAVGGFAGIAFREVLIHGVRRACFSNEAGLGSSPIAHSAAQTSEPVREGVVALLEPFVDTVIICTMTALVILISGAWHHDATGVELTALAFNSAIPGFGDFFVPLAVFLFAYSTLLSWSYYGEQAVIYLFGEKAVMPYKLCFCAAAVAGAMWSLNAIISFSDIMLGLMALPNLLTVLLLLPTIRRETERYFQQLKKQKKA